MGVGGGILPGRFPFMHSRREPGRAPPLQGIRASTSLGFGWMVRRLWRKDGTRAVAEDLFEIAFEPDGLLDAKHHVLRSLTPALGSDDLLQHPLELRPAQARAALLEVARQAGGLIRAELTVEIVLDLMENFVAANLGQDHAP